jgi:DNA polymerase-3 subunit delta'
MGPRGVGKQRLALWLAQAVLCPDAGPQGGCGSCRHCRRVLNLEHPDLHWFFPLARPAKTPPDKLPQALEEARHARLADLRDAPVQPSWSDEVKAIYLAQAQELRRRAGSRPAENGEQVFIIGDAETLVPQAGSQEAANALLKLLEEPPPDTRFILTTGEPGRVLGTIRSRAVPVHVSPLSVDETTSFLVGLDQDPEKARGAAILSGGSIGMALGYMEIEDGGLGPLERLRRGAFDLLRAALEGKPGAGYTLALIPDDPKDPNRQRPWMKQARLLPPLLDALDVWLRDLAAVASGSPGEAVNQDGVPWLRKAADSASLHPAAISEALGTVELARGEARGNVTPMLVVAGLVGRLRAALLESTLSPSPDRT